MGGGMIMEMKDKYLPCGNEMVSIPELRERDGSILSISLLHMGYKGMIEIRGGMEAPLFTPFVSVEGQDAALCDLQWKRDNYWVPHFTQTGGCCTEGTILCPIGERGFIYSLSVKNTTGTEKEFTLGLKGTWAGTMQAINESKPLNGKKYAYKSSWNGSFVLDLRGDAGIFSFAPFPEDGGDTSYEDNDGTISYTVSKTTKLKNGEVFRQNFYWGFGYEEVGAATAALEMKRKGYERVYSSTMKWLGERRRTAGDRRLDEVLNTPVFQLLLRIGHHP
jgi:hypothetical protein